MFSFWGLSNFYNRNSNKDEDENKAQDIFSSSNGITMLERLKLFSMNYKRYQDPIMDEYFNNLLDILLPMDFEGTMRLAVELRRDYNLREVPQYIMMEIADHHLRPEYNRKNPKVFKTSMNAVIKDIEDIGIQFDYWLEKHYNKNGLPTCVKKVWAHKLETMCEYHLERNVEMVPDLVRISHANCTKNKLLQDIIKYY